jgi:hypothetical protein
VFDFLEAGVSRIGLVVFPTVSNHFDTVLHLRSAPVDFLID